MVSRNRTRTRFVVLPPSRLAVPGVFRNIETGNRSYRDLLARMQRLRGRVYLRDQAIHPDNLTADGRHKHSVDQYSWHVLSLDDQDEVVSCLRFLDESDAGGFDDLWLRHASVARCPKLGRRFREAVELALRRTRQAAIRFGEVGGWAVAEDHRWTSEPLRIILATFGLLELLGSCAGVATATFRHSSARILQKIGLNALSVGGEELPPYEDLQYGCTMQALHFDSRTPHSRFRSWIAELSREIAAAPVICPANMATTFDRVWQRLDSPAPAWVPA
jgi:hypothetical protein